MFRGGTRAFEVADDQNVSFRLSDLGLLNNAEDVVSLKLYAGSAAVDAVTVDGTLLNRTYRGVDEQLVGGSEFLITQSSGALCHNRTGCSLNGTVTLYPRRYLAQRVVFALEVVSEVTVAKMNFSALSKASSTTLFTVVVKPVPNRPVLVLNATELTTAEDSVVGFVIVEVYTPDRDGSEVIEIGLSHNAAEVSAVFVNETIASSTLVTRRTDGLFKVSNTLVQIRPATNFGGRIAVQVWVLGIEKTTGENLRVATNVSLAVTDVADVPALNISTDAVLLIQNTSAEVVLSTIALSDTDGSEGLALLVNDVSQSAIARVETKNGTRLAKDTSGRFVLGGLPISSDGLVLRMVPVPTWFGQAQIELTAVATEKFGGSQATRSISVSFSVVPVADKPAIAVEDTRGKLGNWTRIGLLSVSLPDTAKTNATSIAVFLLPRSTRAMEIAWQSQVLTPGSFPNVSTSSLYRVPAESTLRDLSVRVSDWAASLTIEVIVITTIAASNTTQRETRNTTATFAGVHISASSFALKEGATGTFTLQLLGAPTSSVTVTFTSNTTAKAVASPSFVTFLVTDWNVARSVQVIALNNFLEDADASVLLSSLVTSTDSVYSGIEIGAVAVQVLNDDTSKVILFQSVLTTTPNLVVAEGKVFSDQYRIVLQAQPTAEARIAITTSLSQLLVAPTSVTFSPSNWNVSQTIAVSAEDNYILEGDHTGMISHTVTSSDSLYAAKAVESLQVKIVETKDSTPPPKLTSAKFLDTAAGMTITFDRAVNRANLVKDKFECSVLFDLPTTAGLTNYFGADPACSWLASNMSIRFVFGKSATVVPGESLVLRGGLLKSTSTAELATAATTVAVSSPDSPPVPIVQVSGATSLGMCDDLSLDGTGSSGSGGRSMTYTWLLVNSSNAGTTADSVSTLLTQATATNNASLKIVAAVLESDATYSLILQVRNFLGAASNSSVLVVKKSAMALPSVSIKGGGTQAVYRASELVIMASASFPSCSATGSEASSVDMNFAWSQVAGDLSASQAKSTSPNPRVLKLSARTLTVGVTYTFQILVSMAANARINNTASVTLTVMPSSLTASIAGGDRTSGVEQDLFLDASKSTDPDDLQNSVAMQFSWTCFQKSASTGLYDTACKTVDDTLLTMDAKAQVTIPANTINPGISYNFTATALKDTRTSSSSVFIAVAPGSPPSVSIAPLTVAKVNTNDRVVLYGAVLSKLPVKKTEWSIIGNGQSSQNSIFAIPRTGRLTMLLKENSLTPGSSYQFQLYAEDSSGQSSTASITVTVNSPPSSGSLSVTPTSGYALEDTFAALASGWVDDDLPLRYAFRYIKGSAYSGEAEVTMSSSSLEPLFSSMFGLGGGTNNTVTVVAYITDALGATTRVTQEIAVTQKVVAAKDQAAYLANKTDAILAEASSGDPSKVLTTINALGDMINGKEGTTTTSTGTTTSQLKTCPTSNSIPCAANDECIRQPTGCLESNPARIATCSCASGYYGDNCALDQAQYDAKRAALGNFISAMTSASASIDVNDPSAMEQQAASIATLTKSASVLDTAAQSQALNFVDNILMSPVLSTSATKAVGNTISNLLDVEVTVSKSTSSTKSSSTKKSRRLFEAAGSSGGSTSSSGSSSINVGDTSTGSSADIDSGSTGEDDALAAALEHVAALHATIGKLQDAMISSLIAGEEPVMLVSKNLKIVGARDHVSELEGTVVELPLSSAEIAANYTAPSTTVPLGFAAYLAANGSSTNSSDSDNADDPTIDIQAKSFTKNPYSFVGNTTLNSAVTSVNVRQGDKDVAVKGLANPFQLFLRNTEEVVAPEKTDGSNNTAQSFKFFCLKGTVDMKLFNCTGLTSPMSVTCNGTAFSGIATCPVREPACRYWDI